MEQVFQHKDGRKQNSGCTPGSNVALADDELALGKGLDGHTCEQTAQSIVFERRQERKLLPMRMMQHRWRASQVKPRPELHSVHSAAAQHLLSETRHSQCGGKMGREPVLATAFSVLLPLFEVFPS